MSPRKERADDNINGNNVRPVIPSSLDDTNLLISVLLRAKGFDVDDEKGMSIDQLIQESMQSIRRSRRPLTLCVDRHVSC